VDASRSEEHEEVWMGVASQGGAARRSDVCVAAQQVPEGGTQDKRIQLR
jgi:hypothetical protein